MSAIENRVVEMKFDNKDFESNVQTSLGTLDKLNESLKKTEGTKGLEDLANATKGFSLEGIANSVQTIQNKFSAMSVVAITALQNIANSAIEVGKNLINSLAIEPITDGFAEYELKMGSVQTIMASTGASLDEVNGYLAELNTYADRTIYSFSDMTSSIGKFTNAGVDLDSAVKAIQGISNEAAVSGANAEQASHAMYNFAQALSSGAVKLIDWKSIEVANMATVEFKEELIKTAVELGTLVEVEGQYQSTTTDAKGSVSDLFDATRSFNDSLSSQWMTTDVLVQTLGRYADETTELGQKAFAAAQDIKTFTQLMDTLKEAVGSGWAESFELIFGDFNEAKELWTNVSEAISSIIDSSAKARNAMLQTWKDIGGREALLQAFANAWKAITTAVDAVKTAFQDVFPPMTGEKLAAMSEAVRNFTSSLIMSKETSSNLTSVFRGLFSVVDLVGQIFSAVFRSLSPLVGLFFEGSGGILDFSAGIGDAVYNFTQAIKESDLFYNAIQNVIGIVKNAKDRVVEFSEAAVEKFTQLTGLTPEDIWNRIKNAITGALDKLRELFGAATEQPDTKGWEGVHTLFERIHGMLQKVWEILSGIKDKLKEAFSGINFDNITKAFGGLWTIISAIGSGIGTILGGIWKAIKTVFGGIGESLGEMNVDSLKDLASTGVLTAIGLSIKKFVDGLADAAESFGSFKEAFLGEDGIFSALKDTLGAYQDQLKAGTLLKIAAAVGILAASILVISTIDSDRLLSATVAIGAMMAELVTATTILSKVISEDASLKKATSSMISMSAALLLMASAMVKIGNLSWEEIAKGLTGLAGSMAILVAACKLLSSTDKTISKASTAMIAMGAALNIIAKAMEKIGQMQWEEIAKGLVGMSGVFAEIIAVSKLMDSANLKVSTGLALIEISAAMLIFHSALEGFGSMNWDAIGKGLVAMGGVLTELAIFSQVMSGNKMMGIATAMVVLGAAMKIFASALSDFGSMQWDEIGRGLIAMAGALAEIAVAMNLLPKNMLAEAAGLVAVGAALKIIASALDSFGGMTWGEIAKGLTAMGIALAELVVGLNLMSGTLAGSAALLVAAVALSAIAPAMVLMGKMSWGEVAKGLITLAGALTIIVVAAYAAAPVAVPLLALSGAVLALGAAVGLFGAGILAFGAGVTMLATGLAALAASGSAAAVILADAITTVLSSLIALVPTVAKALVGALGAFASSLVEAMPTIIAAVIAITEGVLQALIEITPTLMEALGVILSSLLELIAEFVPEVVDMVANLLIAVLEKIAEYLPDIIQAGVDIVVGFIEGIAQAIPDIVQAAVDLILAFLDGVASMAVQIVDGAFQVIITFINGLADAIRNNTPLLVEAINNLIMAMLEAAIAVIEGQFTLFKNIGQMLMENHFIQGIAEKVSTLIQTVVDFLGKMGSKIQEKYNEFKEKGKSLIANLITGINGKVSAIVQAVQTLITKAKDKISAYVTNFKTIGGNLITGLINGINGKIQSVVNSAVNIGKNLLNSLKNTLGINSPSWKTELMGEYSDEGLANGLIKYAGVVSSAAEDVGDTALDSMSNALSGITDALGEDLPEDPVIRPVLDLSDVTKSANEISSMLSTDRSLELAAQASASMNEPGYGSQNELADAFDTLNSGIVSIDDALNRLGALFGNGGLSSALSSSLASAVREALAGSGVYFDGQRVGEFVTDYQNSSARRHGVATVYR